MTDMDTINKKYLAELDEMAEYPNFKMMGIKGMADYIIANDIKLIRHGSQKMIVDLSIERSPVELEIWCKELYLKRLNKNI
jgi:hypothetical protein